MTWQFYIGTLDREKRTRENFVFLIALEPVKIVSMMNELLEEITPAQRGQGLEPEQVEALHAAVAKMQRHKQGVIMGRNRLAALKKRVGDPFKLTGINYKDIDLEFEIVGVLPASGRYDETAFMNRDYLNDELDSFPRKHGSKHPLAAKSLNIVWLKVADQYDYGRIVWQIESSGYFHNPAVKCETLASAITTVMESYRDLVWGMRWLLSPAVLVTMALVVANAISLSVRERRTELAVMKVLGFRPGQILLLVLGEAVLIGVLSGVLSTALSYGMVNWALRSVNPMPMAIPAAALWWGPALGAGTALAGSLVPALNACRVKVAEVFARVT
jgi:putative ABC transport system permease protein